MKQLKSIFGYLLVAGFAIALFVGCSTDSGTNSVVGPDPAASPNSEPDVAGIDLLKNGQLAMSVFNGVIQDGAIELPVGNNDDIYQVVFLDENDTEFKPSGDQFTLDLTNYRAAVCTIVKHPDLGEWYFCISGTAAGNAEFEVALMDSDNVRTLARCCLLL